MFIIQMTLDLSHVYETNVKRFMYTVQMLLFILSYTCDTNVISYLIFSIALFKYAELFYQMLMMDI